MEVDVQVIDKSRVGTPRALAAVDRGRFRRLVPSAAVHLPKFDAKTFKYASVSVVSMAVSQIVLVTAVSGFKLSGATSNIIAVTAGTVPSYLLNRYWTWNKRTRSRFWREVFPFWAIAVLGLVWSTIAVHWADQRFDSSPVALSLANLFAFAVLWGAKFAFYEAVLFTHHHHLDHQPQI